MKGLVGHWSIGDGCKLCLLYSTSFWRPATFASTHPSMDLLKVMPHLLGALRYKGQLGTQAAPNAIVV